MCSLTEREKFPDTQRIMTDLLSKTRQLLAECELPLREIAVGAGDPVTHEWLRKFAGDYNSDPSVTRIQRLHDFLIARKSRVA
jgi:hypothetical protein